MKKFDLKKTCYLALAAVTAVLILSLTLWAGLSVSGSELRIEEGELSFEHAVRSEYLVGEEVDTEGITLSCGDKSWTGEELAFAVDAETAGDKMVEVSHTEGSVKYRAYFPVRYFYVRHYSVNSLPNGLVFDEVGNVVGVTGLVLYGELSAEPRELPRPMEHHDYTTVIELGAEHYDFSAEKEDNGCYTVTVSFAGWTVNFYFAEAAGEHLVLSGKDRVLSFENKSGTEDRLTLYVTKTETDNTNGTDGAEGIYVFERGGVKRTIRFEYYMEGWGSHFHSNDNGAIAESLQGEDMQVKIGGTTFLASKADWHRAVLEGGFMG